MFAMHLRKYLKKNNNMSYLSELVNEHQNQTKIFINFNQEDEEILKQYAKGMNEKEIINLIKTIW